MTYQPHLSEDATRKTAMRCYGIPLVCRMQLDADPKTHECKQAGKCIFAPERPSGADSEGESK